MPDREKVIKGLECCLGSNDCDVEPEEDCPYQGMCLCAMALRLDVFALLKEQEAVEPTLIREGRNRVCNDYVCPRCDNEVVYEQNYCSECGIPFWWKGR